MYEGLGFLFIRIGNGYFYRQRIAMKYLYLSAALSVLLSACQPQSEEITKAQEPQIPSQEYLVAATLWVQHSAEYRALCYQAYEWAGLRLHSILQNAPSQPAVILDLDETVLDNSAFTGWQIENDEPFSYDSWAKWTAFAEALEVPGAGDFLRLADSLGVTLFYVSNRDTSALQETIQNMERFNMPQLKPEHFLLKTNTSGKEDRRAEIEGRGYEVVLLIGDNLGDFHEKWDKADTATRQRLTNESRSRFGQDYIVLPNPIYGTWEGALYNFDRSLNDSERDAHRKKALRVAPL